MQTERVTLTEFLLARIAEDEAALPGEQGYDTPSGMPDVVPQRWDYNEFHVGPDRWEAECEAKRRIVELHEVYGWRRGSCGTCTDADYIGLVDEGPCDTLRILASVYSDHPDYRDEWRP